MLKKISVPTTGNKNTDNAINYLANEISKVNDAVINPLGTDYEGSLGSIRFVKGQDGYGYLEGRGVDGWYTTFLGAFRKKVPNQRPYPYFEKLMVDELFCTILKLNQIESSREVLISQGGAEVEKITANTITFKDPNNLKTCPFAANDLILCRQLSLDKGAELRKVKATVSSVDKNVCTVTYQYGRAKAGDIFVHVGNTVNAARQNSILFSINDTNAPFIDMYSVIDSWTDWEYTAGAKTKARFGKLDGITDVDFGALSGYGLYAQNVYLKGYINISNPEDINLSEITYDLSYTSGATFPSTPKAGDWHFYTKTPADAPYTTNTWYKRVGTSWTNYGLTGTYIDGTGLYTGTVQANNIIAGTGIVNSLSVLSTLTFGSASTDGYIQTYGWNGTANGIQIKGGATPSISTIGATITGGLIRTAPGGTRIEIGEGLGTQINFINYSGDTNTLSSSTGFLEFSTGIQGDTYINATNGYRVNSSATSGYYLRGNGTNCVLSAIQASDVPSLAASIITSGTFDTARIPNLDAGKITSGTFDAARMPSAVTWSGAQHMNGNLELGSAESTTSAGNLSIAGKNYLRITTTSGTLSITLTGMVEGQLVYISNLGSTFSTTVAGVTIPAGKSALVLYDDVSDVWRNVLSS